MISSTTPVKYVVNLHTHSVDKDGQRTNEDKIFTFENKEIIEARRAAIIKARELEDELTNDSKYVPPYVAAANNYLDYSAYSLTITLHYTFSGVAESVDIYGEDEEEQLEWLEHEASILESFADIEIVIINGDDDNYEIIEEDSDFLLG